MLNQEQAMRLIRQERVHGGKNVTIGDFETNVRLTCIKCPTCLGLICEVLTQLFLGHLLL